MRKKCALCGMICFISDASCKRCGSTELINFPNYIELPVNKQSNPSRSLLVWSYLLFFCLALVIEVVATSPIWGLIGTGPGGDHTDFERSALILNLPTVLLIWFLGKITGSNIILFLLTPFTQIIFLVLFIRLSGT